MSMSRSKFVSNAHVITAVQKEAAQTMGDVLSM